MTFDRRCGSVLPFAVPILCVIPARLHSSRLPHKPLCLLAGEPLVRAVARRALEARFADRVVVATDHPDVTSAVADLPVNVVLTDPAHTCGTERVAEVAALPAYAWADLVVNVQGDEPFFPVDGVRLALEMVRGGRPIATLGAPLTREMTTDENRVKVVVDRAGRALRFSRLLPASGAWRCDVRVLHHIGLYAYTRQALARWAAAPAVPEELEECLEQLRPLRLGLAVGVADLREPVPAGIDTAHDLVEAQRVLDAMSERAYR
jgi:3-deoxy-manno-octulosonate cytidylyltransferase (CMP-KDO synthetase)